MNVGRPTGEKYLLHGGSNHTLTLAAADSMGGSWGLHGGGKTTSSTHGSSSFLNRVTSSLGFESHGSFNTFCWYVVSLCANSS